MVPDPAVPKILSEPLELGSVAICALLFVGVHVFVTLGAFFHLLKQVLQLTAEHLPFVQGLAFDGLGRQEFLAIIVHDLFQTRDLLAGVGTD